MPFNSPEFLIFMAIFMMAWPLARKSRRFRTVLICIASAVFYAWWDWRFLFLIAGSGSVDFLAAAAMDRRPQFRKMLLVLSLVANIGSLAIFKYLGFAADQLRNLLDIPAQQWSWTESIILPIGISFFTFQSMSYTIDVYRGHLRPTRDPLLFFAYLSMFPQLVAGPIVRAKDLIPQLETPGQFNAESRLRGAALATWGFVKKTVIADNLAPVVNDLFGSADVGSNATVWWMASALFAIQIFADFSGYSDIARGIAQWLGYRFPENFRQPYAAQSFRDFWARWHISLSTWFRDYVYIPLGGSRKGAMRNSCNLMATLVISGLWHGANWTFICWGAMHGFLLLAERFVPPTRRVPVAIRSMAGWALTMIGVLVGWVFFRSTSVAQAMLAIRTMFFGDWDLTEAIPMIDANAMVAIIVAALASLWWAVRGQAERRFSTKVSRAAMAAGIVAGIPIAVLFRGSGDAFIYFQF